MESNRSVGGRGRSVRPRKAQFEFSQYGTRSREPSPHIVRDRLTRYASPSRCCRHDGDDLVPRIPQPYRTSFSAVTSPRRMLGTPPASLGSQPLLDTSSSRSSPSQRARSCDMLSEPLRGSPTPDRVETGTVKLDSGEWRDKMRHILGESRSSSDVLTNDPADGKCCEKSKSSSDQAAVDHDTVTQLDVVVTETNPRAAVIKKEYTHAKNLVVLVDASHLANAENCCDEPPVDNSKKKRSRSRLRNFAARTRDSLKVLSGGSTSDVKTNDATRQPSPQSADGRAPRLSNGISRMFQRISHISPKSMRNSGGRRSESCGGRHGNGSDGGRRGSEGSSPNSSNSSLHVHDAIGRNVRDTVKSPAQKPKCRKPSPIRQIFRRRFSGGKSSEKNSIDGKENIPVAMMHRTSEQSPLPQESARIMRTLDDGCIVSPEKTVYQVFKEKQSTQRHTVTDRRPTAVRATCSPTAGQASPSSHCKSPAEPSVIPVATVSEEATRQRPNTLGVRDITKMNKGAFLLPSMSAESIGQCSLDVHSIGK